MAKVEIIFSINTGRSGSSYLASLMKGFETVCSHHEPKPILNEDAMKQYQLGKKDAFDAVLPEKVEQIQKVLAHNKVYFESNHYFIKGFGWEILKNLSEEKIGIIILKRNPEEIIKSYFTIGVSVLGNGAVMHLIHPFSIYASRPFSKNRNLFMLKLFLMRIIVILYNLPFYAGVQKRKNFNIFKRFQLRYLKWYLKEYEYLKSKFIEKYPNLSYLEIDINKMDQDEIIESIRQKFGVGEYRTVQLKWNSAKERLQG